MRINPMVNGTAGGTIAGIFSQLAVGKFAETLVLAALGAVVSFLVSLLLNKLTGRNTKK